MALRPVSELGLVEVTDVATPAAATPAAAAPRRSRRPPKARLETGGRVLPSPHPADDSQTAGSRAAGVAISALSGAVGVAGAVVAARAILRR
jgi:hypothetical protein